MRRISLRDARKAAKLTQVALAGKSGIQQNVISKLESGTVVSPSFTTVIALADALAIDPRALIFGAQSAVSAA